MESIFFKNHNGYILHKFTDEELIPIWNEINFISENKNISEKHNSRLAGNIEHEYTLKQCHNHIGELISPLYDEFNKKFSYVRECSLLTKPVPVVLSDCWVNFQKKYEFNPLHRHNGLLSFVIWMDIPYDIEEEKKQPASINSVNNYPGHFVFHYPQATGAMYSEYFACDKTMNNTILLFPSCVNHEVYPFYTSDKYRITVSGNLMLNP